MAFDITSVLKTAQVREGDEQLVRISLDLIDPDPNNFYSLDGLDELAGNIELIGLQQPLRVRPGSEPGRYTVVSGHRRRAALLMIRDGFDSEDPDRKRWEKAACIVEYGEASEAMRKLRLIYANAATRIMTTAEVSRQTEEVEALLYELKEQGVEFPGRMREHVAKACQISESKLARLHAIRKNLWKGWLERFDAGELPEETAYQLQRLPLEIQQAAELWLSSGKRKNVPKASVVEAVNRNLDGYLAECSCRAHAGGPDCHWKREKILMSLYASLDWQICDPGKCCRDCYQIVTGCSGACQEAKNRRKLEKDAEAEKEAERQKAREREQLVRRQIRKNEAKRLLPLIEAAGLADDDELPGEYYYNKTKISEIRKYAAGDFGDREFYDNSMVPDSARSLKTWAEMLDCSVDFLLGRSEDPKPAAAPAAMSGSDTGTAWNTGTPEEVGIYVLRFGMSTTENPAACAMNFKRWDGSQWLSLQNGVPLPDDMNVYRWLKLPEV